MSLDGEQGDPSPFVILDELAEHAQAAFLVEMDHLIHEKFEFQLLCLRYLASHGWHCFGQELDWRQGERIDAYLRTGDESLLAPIDDGRWYTSGMLAAFHGGDARRPALVAKQQRFAKALRRTIPEARNFGFDVGGGDAEYLALANAANTHQELVPAMALRERLMHQRVSQFMAEHPSEKVALLAGSLHLMKDDDLLDAPAMMPGGGGKEPSLGHYLSHQLGPDRVLSIWLLHGGGHTASPYLAPSGQLVVPNDTVNADLARRWSTPCLARVGPDREPVGVAQMNNLVMTCRLGDQVDAVVFCPEVTAIREIEK